MTWLTLLFRVGAVLYVIYVLKDSSLLERPRLWLIGKSLFMHGLLTCQYCLAFWASLFVFLLPIQAAGVLAIACIAAVLYGRLFDG